MTGDAGALNAHLASGLTSVCRCWAVTRRDGLVLGFTDHDRELSFDGIVFRAESGLTAKALQQSTGLSVDNSEALGALSDPSIREADIVAGRFDGAEVRSWLVNWTAPDQRRLTFQGSLGEIARTGGAFRAELRGLAEALNSPKGRVFQPRCTAILGDASCRFNTSQPGFRMEGPVVSAADGREIRLADTGGQPNNWFRRGSVRFLSGEAAGLTGVVKQDGRASGMRRIVLWETIRAPVIPGDSVRVTAGCDKGATTCRTKFDNMVNFRGFPSIPGEDWLMSYPRRGGGNTGGILR